MGATHTHTRGFTLESGVALVRELEAALSAVGFHAGLTGSVLYKGESRKDLDVIVYPHDKRKQSDVRIAIAALEAAGVEFIYGDPSPYNDKLVYVTTLRGQRIDFFLLS